MRRPSSSPLLRLTRRVGLLAVVAAFACSSPTGPLHDGRDPTVHATAAGIVIRNPSPVTVYHFVSGARSLAHINWAPSVHDDRDALPGAAEVLVPWPERGIGGIESEFVVFWWRATADGRGGFKPDSVRALDVAR